MEVNRKGGNVPRSAEMIDPLPGLCSRTYGGIDDGSYTPNAPDRDLN